MYQYIKVSKISGWSNHNNPILFERSSNLPNSFVNNPLICKQHLQKVPVLTPNTLSLYQIQLYYIKITNDILYGYTII